MGDRRTYRVIQWATGGVGRAAIEGIVGHPDLELVGCWVHGAEKAGVDVGELVGIGPIGVRATNDVAQLLALEADCVMYSPIMAKREEVIRILESGKNVVTPLNWFYPNKAKVADLEQACQKGGVTLHMLSGNRVAYLDTNGSGNPVVGARPQSRTPAPKSTSPTRTGQTGPRASHHPPETTTPSSEAVRNIENANP